MNPSGARAPPGFLYGVVWHVEYRFPWDEWYADAARYREEHGDLLVPLGYLTPEEIASLDALGMVWSIPRLRGSRWEENYAAVRAFVQSHRALPTKRRDGALPDGKSMHYWLCAQREAWMKGRLTTDREERLRQLGLDRPMPRGKEME